MYFTQVSPYYKPINTCASSVNFIVTAPATTAIVKTLYLTSSEGATATAKMNNTMSEMTEMDYLLWDFIPILIAFIVGFAILVVSAGCSNKCRNFWKHSNCLVVRRPPH